MAKRKKRSKVQKGAKRNSAKRSKARKVSKSARKKATKRPVAKAMKRATVKKPAQKEVRPSAVVVEAVVVEEASPDAIIVAEGLDPAA